MDNLQSMNSGGGGGGDQQNSSHLFQSSHYSPDENSDYQALDASQHQQYLADNSPEFYAANSLLDSKYHQHYVKNFVRSSGKTILKYLHFFRKNMLDGLFLCLFASWKFSPYSFSIVNDVNDLQLEFKFKAMLTAIESCKYDPYLVSLFTDRDCHTI